MRRWLCGHGRCNDLTDIGGMQLGDFESRGDIAGIGVRLHLVIWVSSLTHTGSALFVFPTIIMLVFAALMLVGTMYNLQ